MSGRVFAPQEPAYYDRAEHRWVPKFDLTPAETFGELRFALGPGNVHGETMDAAVRALAGAVADFDADTDHVLAVGDPVLIALLVLHAAASCPGGYVSVLRYDRLTSAYLSVRVPVPNEGPSRLGPAA